MQFDHYDEIPKNIAEKIIGKSKSAAAKLKKQLQKKLSYIIINAKFIKISN